MRICLPFIGDTVGGSHLSSILLAQGLAGHGADVLIVVHQPGPLTTLLTERGVPFERAPVTTGAQAGTRTGYLRAVAGATRGLRRFLRGRGVTMLHTNDLRTHRAWMFAAKAAGIPHVWHQRTRFYAPRFGRVQLRVPDLIISISQYVDGTLPDFARRKSVIVTNPFDTNAAPPDRVDSRRSLLGEIGADASSRIVGFVGNLTDQKRPLVFVEMAGILAPTLQDVHFAMFGADRSGNGDRVRRRAHDLGIATRVHHLGFRSPVEPAIAACDVLVAPGVRDGSGRSLVEAMLVGTPVVAAHSGGHPEVIDDRRTGVLVQPDAPVAFAAAVDRLVRDTDYARGIASEAYATAAARYSIAGHAREVLDVYHQLT